ncbi:cellulose synthase complex periplasmic endoglucanase BcsZ [Pseudomonas sp. 5P_3.1_Bac2]|uniref:cellulose synthase complex periplasmic endoglucanase BcsZ n=1 Tax=Pseudomonas sp. 5P_3.1_Bac2 TaxID=2971617 RepID=UPI0021C9CF45|nr:cellulose synthase complex periplasmic endoglucanase BcsZ [Pseudomonas sp. 5P_3.1_Bac2]MCU1717241.1 cellulose synthase complex periplasmic endoglucanase BcsZ [Pseudomonas sp. 5P_3.1_Bac2]
MNSLRNVLLSLLLLASGSVQAQAQSCATEPWWLWSLFTEHFIQDDGRVVDASTPQLHSSSEGQSYAMFFALLANDPATFERLWRWTVSNLAGGDISQNLPAWFWGKHSDGSWVVLDSNSAADADLWFVYSLLEAGQRWQRQDYLDDAKRLLDNMEQREFAQMPGLGRMLLPGVNGFVQADQLWVLNPSYLPLPVLRRIQRAAPHGPWAEVTGALPRLLREGSPHGFAPDWLGYRAVAPQQGMFVESNLRGGQGSYDAIRTYLWAGLTAAADPAAADILRSLNGMVRAVAVTGMPPEKVNIAQGSTEGIGPFGFSAALLPYLQASGKPWLAEIQQRRVLSELKASVTPERVKKAQPPYYDFVLSLFALGWSEQQFSFRPDGGIDLKWEKKCSQGATSSP